MGGVLLRYRNLSIRGKMLLGFAAVIGLVGLGNLYGFVSYARITGDAVFARDTASRKVMFLMEVEGEVNRIARSAATATQEAHAGAQSLARELKQKLGAARTEFARDRRLDSDLDDLGQRLDEHLQRSEQLLDLSTHRDSSAFESLLREFQESQQQVFQRVAEAKGRCLKDLEDSQRRVASQTRITTLSTAAVTALALLAAVLTALKLSDELVQPLRRLTELIGEARAGDFSIRADGEGADERAGLARGFNELLQHLQKRDAELTLHRNHLEELAEERTAQLEVANRALKRELETRSVAERALAESEERLRRILDSVHAGILIVDAESRQIVDANAFALELMGAARDEVVGHPCHGTACPENDICPLSIEGTALENSEGQLKRADGWCLPVLRSVVPVAHQGGTHLIESFIDLSEVKRQEKALRESEQRYRTLFACAQDAIFILDARPGAQLRIVDLNPAAARMHGYLPDELVGRSLEVIDNGSLFAEGRGDAIQRGEWVVAEIEQRRRDGGVFPVQVAAGPLDYADARHILTFSRDVTESKRAREELEAFNDRLRRSNQDLEEFAYVASHDLQEPLRKVQAFGDRLRAKCGDDLGEQGSDYLARMQNASRRMQQLIEGLLAFSRVTTQAQPFALVDLGQVAREVLSDLEVRIEQSGARVELGALPALEGDPLQMRQLLQNLIGNALKFRKPDQPPIVRVSGEVLQGDGDGIKGPRVRLTVEDEGIGFEPKYADRIFGVFQRLQGRGEYEGTGVGLAVCRKIVERHGGRIVAEGSPGCGARFLATLPARRAT